MCDACEACVRLGQSGDARASGYLQDEAVRYKKYLYVLRPLLAVQWIDEGRGMPPMRVADLVAGTVDDPVLLAEINALLEVKKCVLAKRNTVHAGRRSTVLSKRRWLMCKARLTTSGHRAKLPRWTPI